MLTGAGLKQSPIYSCQKYLKLRDKARLGGGSVQGRKGGKDPAATLGCPTGKEQPGSSGTHRKDKGQEGTGTRCRKGKIIHPENDQTLHPEPKGAEKCPVRCSKLSRTGPEPAGTTLKAAQLWSRALQVLSKPSSSAMLIFLPNLPAHNSVINSSTNN